ncbi:hypothetical protein NGA_0626000, partial [Nannochloropsis gaditana CCMP526]|uniref:uncharacterized protein n=1 Tax=Nannochloropsis gaditana (strain CCMP526) TaxID=1093141 RepID=UPI00029F56EF
RGVRRHLILSISAVVALVGTGLVLLDISTSGWLPVGRMDGHPAQNEPRSLQAGEANVAPDTASFNRSHKNLWPLNTRDSVTLVLATSGLILAADGGFEAGGLLVPLLLLVQQFPIRQAVPLSNIAML